MSLTEILEPTLVGLPGYALAAFLGLVFGSFANVCIYRWPEDRSVVSPGSHCGVCGAPVRWYDNLPILSYLLLRGRCRDCGTSFSPRYLFVELATGILFVALFHATVGIDFATAPLPVRLGRFGVYAAFAFTMVVITFIDLDHKLILNKVTFPSIPIFYGLGLTLPERHWSDGLIGIVVGYGIVRLIADGYRVLAGRDGMGYGDGKLLAVIGALFGWQAVVFALFGGSLLGTLIAIPLILLHRRREPSVADSEAAAPERHPDDESADANRAEDSGESTDPEQNEEQAAEQAEDGLRHVELPFGPYLAAAALIWALLGSWSPVSFDRLLSGAGLL